MLGWAGRYNEVSKMAAAGLPAGDWSPAARSLQVAAAFTTLTTPHHRSDTSGKSVLSVLNIAQKTGNLKFKNRKQIIYTTSGNSHFIALTAQKLEQKLNFIRKDFVSMTRQWPLSLKLGKDDIVNNFVGFGHSMYLEPGTGLGGRGQRLRVLNTAGPLWYIFQFIQYCQHLS